MEVLTQQYTELSTFSCFSSLGCFFVCCFLFLLFGNDHVGVTRCKMHVGWRRVIIREASDQTESRVHVYTHRWGCSVGSVDEDNRCRARRQFVKRRHCYLAPDVAFSGSPTASTQGGEASREGEERKGGGGWAAKRCRVAIKVAWKLKCWTCVQAGEHNGSGKHGEDDDLDLGCVTSTAMAEVIRDNGTAIKSVLKIIIDALFWSLNFFLISLYLH